MKYNLKIGWLYSDLMNIYGDRGNIIVLEKRCEWRHIQTEVLTLNVGFAKEKLSECDILLMGGAQDKQQEATSKDLLEKSDILKDRIENGIPGLYVCGAYQFLGNFYKEANGNIIKGLGIFDLYTQNPGKNNKRLIGNMAFRSPLLDYVLIGFENHGGRTYLGNKIQPFGTIIKGFGNNGVDQTEGAIYKNSFGTYSHGPILPKNPKFADYLIEKALNIKYKENIKFENMNINEEEKARMAIAKRLSVEI